LIDDSIARSSMSGLQPQWIAKFKIVLEK